MWEDRNWTRAEREDEQCKRGLATSAQALVVLWSRHPDLNRGPTTRYQAGTENLHPVGLHSEGLGLRITPKGVKSYILNYRINGRERRATLARTSEISLKIARERAGEQLVRIRAGETDPLERKREAKEAPTVGDGLRRFFDEFRTGASRDGTLESTHRDRLPMDGRPLS